MNFLRQQLVACHVSFGSLRQRLGLAFVIVIGMACVIGVTLSMLSLTEGLTRTFTAGGEPKNALVSAADGSDLDAATVATILNAPGIAVGPDGKLLASAEALQWLPPAAGFSEGSLYLLGIAPSWPALTPGFHIISGRMFRTGKQELIVGQGAESLFGLKVGTSVILPNGEWPIVGTFAANGSSAESALLGDLETVVTAARLSRYSTVVAELTSPAAFDEFKRWLTTNPALSVTAERQPDFLARTAGGDTQFFTTIAYLVGSMMGIGAVFGSVRIMYATVEARTREIATLRAIGYAPLPLAMTVLLETVFLSLIGALLGSVIAWLFFNDMQAISGHTVFRLHISAHMVTAGFGVAAILAVLGGLLPAIRAGRMPVAYAIQQ